MIRCSKLDSLLGTGSCRPFLARGSQGSLFVVKPHAKAHDDTPLFTKSLFNEFVGSLLARLIGLPWPDVELALLEETIIKQLERAGYIISSEWAVGLSYIDGLKPFSRSDYSIEKRRYLKKAISDPQSNTFFYGKSVFDNWVLLEDWKYDTLQIMKNGFPVFLDASMAFGGVEYGTGLLQWNEPEMHFDRSPYLSGVLNDFSQFNPWLWKLQSLEDKVYKNILKEVPLEWSVTSDYISAIGELLVQTPRRFISVFKEKIEWETNLQLM
jgi:hypothetical protein